MDTEVITVAITTLDLLPGQVLIVRVPKALSSESIRSIEGALRGVLGNDARWLIAPDDIEFVVVDPNALGEAHV
jgi:hypothetical protein